MTPTVIMLIFHPFQRRKQDKRSNPVINLSKIFQKQEYMQKGQQTFPHANILPALKLINQQQQHKGRAKY